MDKFAPKYEKGVTIENKQTGGKYVILDMEYCKLMCDIMYKIQHSRYKFDVTMIPETIIDRNLKEENYEIT